MRVDELQQGLASARDSQLAADAVAGRRGVDHRVRRQRVQRAGLALVVVVLLAGVGVFLASRGTDEQRVISGPGAIPHYLPDPLPAGSPRLQELPLLSAPERDTFGSRLEGVVWTSDPSDSPSPDSPVLAIEIATGAGPDPSLAEPYTTSFNGITMMRWNDQQGVVGTLRATDLNEEELAAIRQTVRVDVSGAVSLIPPAGYREVFRKVYDYSSIAPSAELSVFTPLVDVTQPGDVVSFSDAESDGINPSYSVAAVPRSQLWVILVSGYGEFEQLEIRGRLGYRWVLTGTSQTASTDGVGERRTTEVASMFFWWENDDVLLAALGPTDAEARLLAESLHEVSDDEWARFVASAQPFSTADGQASSATSGSGSGIATSSSVTVP